MTCVNTIRTLLPMTKPNPSTLHSTSDFSTQKLFPREIFHSFFFLLSPFHTTQLQSGKLLSPSPTPLHSPLPDDNHNRKLESLTFGNDDSLLSRQSEQT